ncbi:MAG: zincin-like metallopeptidase domain-containing protein [Snowella sp.]|nr:zincin-like metallopeptidase domain-containing protein [Snowella sp.]
MNDKIIKLVNDRLTKLIEENPNMTWKQLWKKKQATNFQGRKYTGINRALLCAAPYGCNIFASYKQILDAGGQVKRGEKGWPVIFWKILQDKEDATKTIPLLRYYCVFNLEQTNMDIPKGNDNIEIVEAENVIKCYANKPEIKHNMGECFYSPLSDYVSVPPIDSFTTSSEYYVGLFHELVHSTGHKSRLNRPGFDGLAMLGSESYSREELVAECGAAYLMSLTGLDASDNQAAYIKSWMKHLKNDKGDLIVGMGKAERAVDYILGR